MNDMNKKLLEFAGFKYLPETGLWLYPDSNIECLSLPNFLESLDACFKWLIPKLSGWQLMPDDISDGSSFVIACLPDKLEFSIAETASLALCEAIIKLLEENNAVSKVS